MEFLSVVISFSAILLQTMALPVAVTIDKPRLQKRQKGVPKQRPRTTFIRPAPLSFSSKGSMAARNVPK
jgi:hypothetical protein